MRRSFGVAVALLGGGCAGLLGIDQIDYTGQDAGVDGSANDATREPTPDGGSEAGDAGIALDGSALPCSTQANAAQPVALCADFDESPARYYARGVGAVLPTPGPFGGTMELVDGGFSAPTRLRLLSPPGADVPLELAIQNVSVRKARVSVRFRNDNSPIDAEGRAFWLHVGANGCYVAISRVPSNDGKGQVSVHCKDANDVDHSGYDTNFVFPAVGVWEDLVVELSLDPPAYAEVRRGGLRAARVDLGAVQLPNGTQLSVVLGAENRGDAGTLIYAYDDVVAEVLSP